MKKNTHRIVVVKHKKPPRHRAGHDSWKIAYADFMTAMMALFLVLSLIGSSTPIQLKHVADYFRTPLNMSLTSGSRFSDSESPIPGGGDDFTRIDGEERKEELTAEQEIEYNRKHTDTLRLLDIGKKVVDAIQLDPRLNALAPNIIVELTEVGLRIQILSRNKQPMFAIGSAKIQPDMKAILHAIAPILNTLPNNITLSGHTDERKYPRGDRGYSNWELSADRANASRRELIAGGLEMKKIIRVLALADTVPLNNPDISAESNRRISIVILNKEANRRIIHENIITGIDLLNNAAKVKQQVEQPYVIDAKPAHASPLFKEISAAPNN